MTEEGFFKSLRMLDSPQIAIEYPPRWHESISAKLQRTSDAGVEPKVFANRYDWFVQIVVPMSGFGERFRAEGFTVPKPLIQVDGKTMVEHVVNLFPGDHDFVFICNENHLNEKSWGMRDLLSSIAESTRIVSIPSHKLGPVYAILSAEKDLELNAETVVNYCDFTCAWSFAEFIEDIQRRDLDGAVPAYRGFHPHSGGSTNYAYINERNMLLRAIQEKSPFTSNKTLEFASSGTYYFRSARLMLDLFKEQVSEELSVSGEFYVSSSMELLAKRGSKVGVFQIDHFMQWGTPQDLEEYRYHSAVFEKLSSLSPMKAIDGAGAVFVLASGLGVRFAQEGYSCPKPLLPVSGESLAAQVAKAGGGARAVTVSVVSKKIADGLTESGFNRLHQMLRPTNGQAHSASILLRSTAKEAQGAITILPSDTLFFEGSDQLSRLTVGLSQFVVAWATLPTPFALKNPQQYGWIKKVGDRVIAEIKQFPSAPDSLVLSGAFTFSSLGTFNLLFDHIARETSLDETEVYLDNFVNAADDLGIPVLVFIPELTVSLGTPVEYESFIYWQRCFDQWEDHRYSLEKDPFQSPGNQDSSEGHPSIESATDG